MTQNSKEATGARRTVKGAGHMLQERKGGREDAMERRAESMVCHCEKESCKIVDRSGWTYVIEREVALSLSLSLSFSLSLSLSLSSLFFPFFLAIVDRLQYPLSLSFFLSF